MKNTKKILLGLTVVLALVCVLALAISATEYKIPVRDGWEEAGGPMGVINGDTANGWKNSGYTDIDGHVSFSRGDNDVWVMIAVNGTTDLKSDKYPNLTYGNSFNAYFNEYERKVVIVAQGNMHSQLNAYMQQDQPSALEKIAKNYALWDKLYNLYALEYVFTLDAFKDKEVPGLGMTWSEYMSSKVKASSIYSVSFPSDVTNANADTRTNEAIIVMERAIANALYTKYSANATYAAAYAEASNPSTLTGSTYVPASDKQKMSRALLTGLVLYAQELGADEATTSAVSAAAKDYAYNSNIKYYFVKGSGGSFGWKSGLENYMGDYGYVAMAFLINPTTSENANVGCLGNYVDVLELRNPGSATRNFQNFGSVLAAFDKTTTVLIDTTLVTFAPESNASRDRGMFRKMESLNTIAHVTFAKDGTYTGDVVADVVDLSGFNANSKTDYGYTGYMLWDSDSVKNVVYYEKLMWASANGSVDVSGVIYNCTLYQANGLETFTLPANADTPLSKIGENVFAESGLKEMYVLRSVSADLTIDSSAFSGCSSVTMYVLDKTSAANAQNALKTAGIKNVKVDLFNPLSNPVTLTGALVKMKDFDTAASDKLAIRFQFAWEEKGEAALANAGYTFKNLGIIASTAATYNSYMAKLESETGLASASLTAHEMLANAGTDGSGVVQVLVTNADFTEGRRTFLKGYDSDTGYYPFCLSLYGMTDAQITTEFYVAAYTEWADANGNTYYTFTSYDYVKDGVAKNAISLYDTTLGLVKQGLINGSDYESEEDADKYFYSVLEKGALTTSSFTSHATAAKNGYTDFLNNGSFTYWNVDYRNYINGTTTAGWGYAPDAVEATSTSGIQFSILKDGAEYVVLITKDKNAPEGATYTIPVAGRSSSKGYYQPFHYRYGDTSNVSTNAKANMIVYSPAVTQTVFNAITTVVVDDGVVKLDADSLANITNAHTFVLPESCVQIDAFAISKNANLKDIIWTGDPDAKSEEKYNVAHLYDLRGCTAGISSGSFINDNKAVENVVTAVSVNVDGQLTFNNATNLERYWSTKVYSAKDYSKPDAGVIDVSKSWHGTINKGYFNTGSKINTIIVQGTLKIYHNKFTSDEDDRSYRPIGKGQSYNFILTDSSGKRIDYVWNGADGEGNTQFLKSLYALIVDLRAGAKTAEAANCDNISVNGVSVKTLFSDLYQ